MAKLVDLTYSDMRLLVSEAQQHETAGKLEQAHEELGIVIDRARKARQRIRARQRRELRRNQELS